MWMRKTFTQDILCQATGGHTISCLLAPLDCSESIESSFDRIRPVPSGSAKQCPKGDVENHDNEATKPLQKN